MTAPLVTVSLVSHNGMRWLPGCLASVWAQDLADFELLALDNASVDDTPRWLGAQTERRLHLEISPANLGFAAGHNRNIAKARGEFVLLLNQDVELHPAFLREAVNAFADRPGVAAVEGRLRRLGPAGERGETLDTTGLEMQRNRRFVSRAQGEIDGPQHQVAGPVWGADGPAPVYRRAALIDAREPCSSGGWEILDEDFFMYKEDVDLAWRLRRLGWTAWYAPQALGWHARSGGGPPASTLLAIARTNWTIPSRIKALSWRNQRLMQVKNETALLFLRDLPWIMVREVLSMAFILFADPRRLRALPQLLRALPSARRKRHFLLKRLRSRSAIRPGVD